MHKKLASMLLIGLLAASTMAGCVQSTGPTTNAQADSGAQAESAATNDSETPAAESANSGDSITLTIWDWDEAHLSHMPVFYQQTHPGVEFDTMVVSANDYMQKLQSTLASGIEVPDIILGELSYRGRVFELGIVEDLSQAPYNLDRSEMFDFAVTLETGPGGELLGVEQQICPTGFAYRRDLAAEYLGVSEPDEIYALIPDWDAFITQGQAVVEKSDGAVTIFPGISVFANDVLREQDPSSYIDGDTINITERYTGMFEQAVRVNQAGILGNQERDTPALANGFSAGEFIFFPCPPWALKWEIQVNDPDGEGRWGLVKAPSGGFTRGGTSVSIYSDSPYKEEAWEYIRYTYCDGDGVREAYEQFGFMTGFKAPYEDENSYFFSSKGVYDDYFGGQNLAEYYINEITLETKGQIQTRNESAVREALLAVIAQLANDRTMTAEQAIEHLKQETSIMLPEATVN